MEEAICFSSKHPSSKQTQARCLLQAENGALLDGRIASKYIMMLDETVNR